MAWSTFTLRFRISMLRRVTSLTMSSFLLGPSSGQKPKSLIATPLLCSSKPYMAEPSGSPLPSPKRVARGPPPLLAYSCKSLLKVAKTSATDSSWPRSVTFVDPRTSVSAVSVGIRSLTMWSMKRAWDKWAGKVCFREGPMVSPSMSTCVAPFSATPATSKSNICTCFRVTPSLLLPWMEWCEESPNLQFCIVTFFAKTGTPGVVKALANCGGPSPFRNGEEPSSMLEKKRWSL
mmetsp:Transcript_68317/g.203247  ORF Transcript_68317/g.203247 Transcript_68317/m.203247 type:complete len:234 (-) Transcript_68317:565-1266(-)